MIMIIKFIIIFFSFRKLQRSFSTRYTFRCAEIILMRKIYPYYHRFLRHTIFNNSTCDIHYWNKIFVLTLSNTFVNRIHYCPIFSLLTFMFKFYSFMLQLFSSIVMETLTECLEGFKRA